LHTNEFPGDVQGFELVLKLGVVGQGGLKPSPITSTVRQPHSELNQRTTRQPAPLTGQCGKTHQPQAGKIHFLNSFSPLNSYKLSLTISKRNMHYYPLSYSAQMMQNLCPWTWLISPTVLPASKDFPKRAQELLEMWLLFSLHNNQWILSLIFQ